MYIQCSRAEIHFWEQHPMRGMSLSDDILWFTGRFYPSRIPNCQSSFHKHRAYNAKTLRDLQRYCFFRKATWRKIALLLCSLLRTCRFQAKQSTECKYRSSHQTTTRQICLEDVPEFRPQQVAPMKECTYVVSLSKRRYVEMDFYEKIFHLWYRLVAHDNPLQDFEYIGVPWRCVIKFSILQPHFF